MSDPEHTIRTLRPIPGLVTLVPVLTAAWIVSATAAECPGVTVTTPSAAELLAAPRAAATAQGEEPLYIESDGLDAARDGEWLLKGEVTVTQGERKLSTRDATYDPQSQSIDVKNGVEYADPDLKVRGSGAHFESQGGATFEGAQFEIPSAQARGSARRLGATIEGDVSLDGVRYTTCPLGNNDWELRASGIDISQQRAQGFGRNVRIDFKGIPILYMPIISFPVGNERKSGFLFPSFATSSRSGTSLSVPIYWDIAPQRDATFQPQWFSKRGTKLDTEFRYMNEFGRGTLNSEYLPDDLQFGDSRSFLEFTDQSDFGDSFRLNLNGSNVSDRQWFEDFGLGPEGTSVSYLNRVAALTYQDDYILATARAQNFQTIDDTIDPLDRPYTILPQLALSARLPGQPYGLQFGLQGEVVRFDRKVGVTGSRVDIAPEVRLPLRSAGIYLEPAVNWRYTAYDLQNVAPGAEEAPDRMLPTFSVDGGMTFERDTGSSNERIQTFEPRLRYAYVPFRNQDALQPFDTRAADLNLVQLFRTNRFAGPDRVSNANQLTLGVTSRLLDASSGRQFLSATLGQTYFFDPPRVRLPGEVIDDTESSDLVGELNLTAFRNWNVRLGLQWDPGDMRSEKGDVLFQYQPRHDQVVNLAYRFRHDSSQQSLRNSDGVEQVDGSAAWPISKKWSAYARLVYSIEERQSLDQFAGLEFRSCCWRMRAVTRRFVRNRDGDLETSFMFQIELNGLSSVGDADAFLERSIQGYSAMPPVPAPIVPRTR
jgi:LPS-assembly protein